MAEKKFPKGSEEWMMFMDFWALCQKYWEPEKSDTWWEKVIDETASFVNKYGTNFAKRLGLALIDDLERRSRKKWESH